ncbi:MAG: zinc-ribbon domain-containing protein [Acidobacteriota bacterium]
MFCPKCGTQNPETGKFCRSCGTDLGNVTEALTGKLQRRNIVDRKGKPVSYEGAIVKMFTGLAFLVVTIALAFSRTGNGWWFWMLIPAFTSLGAGIAQFVQLRNASGAGTSSFSPEERPAIAEAPQNAGLPPSQTQYVSPLAESRYKTGDLVPPSVTDGTTRHLEMDKEGETMTLPKI